MKRSFLILFLVCLLYSLTENRAEGQLWKIRRYEAVAGLGPTMFFGDIGGFSKNENILGLKDMSFLQTRFGLNLGMKYRITNDINIRLSLTFGTLHATDVRGSNERREMEAAMRIFEPALIGEYYFIKNEEENSYLFEKGRSRGLRSFFASMDFYGFTGLGGIRYSVTGTDRQLSRDFDTKGFAAVIPVGVGTNFVYSPRFNYGVEFGGRYVFSDNLDGYTSQYSK